jgi:predicted site-specific integrase-resolvase
MVHVMEQTISVTEAAERLGITTAEAYDLVFARTLRTVESQTGRRVVPLEALEELRTHREAASEPA